VTAAVIIPYGFERRDHLVDTVVEQTGQAQIAEGLHKGQLLRAELQFFHMYFPLCGPGPCLRII
jgi:hypothetical protein